MNDAVLRTQKRWLHATLYWMIRRTHPWISYPSLLDAVRSSFARHILQLRAEGFTMREIAATSGVTTTTLNNLLNRRPRRDDVPAVRLMTDLREAGPQGATLPQLVNTLPGEVGGSGRAVSHLLSALEKAGALERDGTTYRLSSPPPVQNARVPPRPAECQPRFM